MGPKADLAAYVAAFISEVQPNMLSFDHYPDFQGAELPDLSVRGKTCGGYHFTLAVFRNASLASGLPFFNFFSSMFYAGSGADQTEAQLRWQVFTSLAYGAKGLLYFCYWSPAGPTFQWGGALMMPRAVWNASDPSPAVAYEPGPHFAQAQRINSKLLTYGSALLQATSTGVFYVSAGMAAEAPVPAGFPVAAVGGSNSSTSPAAFGALLGFFSLPSGRTALLLHNQNSAYAVQLTVVLAAEAAQAPVWELDAGSGLQAPVRDDAPGIPGLQLSLEAGDARLLLFLK
jgi:hypothetical protein